MLFVPSPALRTAIRVFLGVLFPLAVGASGCCGCPVGLCTSILRAGSSAPPPPPVGAPWGTGGGGGGPSPSPGAEAPLTPEPFSGGTEASRGSAKSLSLMADKRAPLRGAIMRESGSLRFVVHKALSAAPVGNGSSFVVAGPTGVWLHDTKTLARTSRLVPSAVLDVASSPDGSRFAYTARGGLVRVLAFPSLKQLAFTSVDEPCRIRFSADGQRVATASQSDTVTLLDVATGKKNVYDTDEDVNDVFPMPDRPEEVAYASDDDEVAIADVVKGRKTFGSEELVETWRHRNKPFFTMRDQLAVAFDSVTGSLLGGGDDNMLWRIDDLRSAPSIRSPIELSGNVVDIACCAGASKADRAAYVATDDLSVHAVALDGRFGPEFGPLGSSITSLKIRIALLPSGDVLVTPQSMLFRWEPRTGDALRSSEYSAPVLPLMSSLDADTVVFACDGRGCVVQRVEHAKEEPDVETKLIGEPDFEAALSILGFSDGTRALAGAKAGKLRLVYLPKGGALEPPIDTTASTSGGFDSGKFAQKDGKTHGFLDVLGDVYEITASPRAARKVGSAPGTDSASTFQWDSGSSRWRVVRAGNVAFVP